jgi:hypothetical protein
VLCVVLKGQASMHVWKILLLPVRLFFFLRILRLKHIDFFKI